MGGSRCHSEKIIGKSSQNSLALNSVIGDVSHPTFSFALVNFLPLPIHAREYVQFAKDKGLLVTRANHWRICHLAIGIHNGRYRISVLPTLTRCPMCLMDIRRSLLRHRASNDSVRFSSVGSCSTF